jgi:DNA-binding MarR family transcriptional regulator
MSAEDRYEITWLVRRLFRAMAARADTNLSPYGISAADRAVLEFLYPDTALSVPEIAERYNVSRQHIQVTVNRLKEKGLVALRNNPRHKRSPHILLTRSGRTLFTEIRAADLALIDRLFAAIPESNQKVTKRTLGKLVDRLETGDLQ